MCLFNQMSCSSGNGFIFFLWLALLAVLLFQVVRCFRGNAGCFSKTGNAMDVLKKRYAEGEMSKEEFEEKKKDLQ